MKYKPQKATVLKGEADKSTAVGGDFNTPLSVSDRISGQHVHWDAEELDGTGN